MRELNSYSRLLFWGCFAILMVGCDLSNKQDFEETYTYSFQKDKHIIVDTTARQITDDSTQSILSISSQPGNDLVFHYEKQIIPPPEVMDGGSITNVYFQIPSDTEKFIYEGDGLNNANVFFKRSCFCPIIGALKVENGILEGQRLSENLWSISATLQPQGPRETYTIEFRGVFILNSD